MPLRFLDTVTYIGDAGEGESVLSKNILLLLPSDYSRRKEQCPLDVPGGIDMARRYLTSVFIRVLVVSDHRDRLPKSELLTAHEEHIDCISFERCSFNETTNVRRYPRNDARFVAPTGARFTALTQDKLVVARDDFGQLFVKNSNLPGSWVTDDLLHILCCAECSFVELPRSRYAVTDEGILDYCFSSDLGALKDGGRTLLLKDALVTPELPEKCIQASSESKVTGRVKLLVASEDMESTLMDNLAALSDNLVDDVVDYNDDDDFTHILRYNFPEQGNGMSLQIEIAQSGNLYGYWVLQMRRGNKDDEAFFDSAFEDV